MTENAGIKGKCFGSQKESVSGEKKDEIKGEVVELFLKRRRKNWIRKYEFLAYFVLTSYSQRSANAVLRAS